MSIVDRKPVFNETLNPKYEGYDNAPYNPDNDQRGHLGTEDDIRMELWAKSILDKAKKFIIGEPPITEPDIVPVVYFDKENEELVYIDEDNNRTTYGLGGAVDSVFGRTGSVTAQSGDYTADQVTETATKVFVTPSEKTAITHTNRAVLDATTSSFTTADKTKLAGIEAGADVTDTANVTSAGALMDSEVTSLSGIKTLVVPDNTTITSAAATVLDDTTVGDMVNTLGGATSTGTGGLVRSGSPALTTPSIAAINVSGGILTLPTGASDTIVSRNSTETLTNKTLTKPIINGSVQGVTADTDGATITFNMASSNVHTVTLAGNRTLALSNVSVGQFFTLRLQQDATGSRTVTWFSTIKWSGGSAPTLTTTANKADLLGFFCTSAGNYDGCVVMSNL